MGNIQEKNILTVNDLNVSINTDRGNVRILRDVSFSLEKGKVLGIVGESGSGKTISAYSIMGLLPKPYAKIDSGEIIFSGKDLTKINRSEMTNIRGNRISMIFQEPMTALNPVLTIGKQLSETFEIHKKKDFSGKEIKEKCISLLNKVGISDPSKRYDEYPHQLSGGMRQRVMIAMALALEPELIIADEPTTALDVTIQSQILDLILSLIKESGTSLIFITHDMGVIARISDQVAVMYGGEIVENSPVKDLFREPAHPYTKGLLQSIPKMEHPKKEILPVAMKNQTGEIHPDKDSCLFYDRCVEASDECLKDRIRMKTSGKREARCIKWKI